MTDDANKPRTMADFITTLLVAPKYRCDVHGEVEEAHTLSITLNDHTHKVIHETPRYCLRCAIDWFAKQGVNAVSPVKPPVHPQRFAE